MHIESENDEIEIGVFVEDAWQYRGIGRLLVERLAAEARDAGIEAFTCASLWENHPDGTVRGDEDLGDLACRLSQVFTSQICVILRMAEAVNPTNFVYGLFRKPPEGVDTDEATIEKVDFQRS